MPKKPRRYKYLGKRVKDERKPGLDTVREYERILREILRDYKAGRISKKTAQGRLLLLYRLVFRNRKFQVSGKTKKKLAEKIRVAMRRL